MDAIVAPPSPSKARDLQCRSANDMMDYEDEAMSDSTKIDFIYLSEPDMVQAGVTDMPACVDAMEEMFALLSKGDYRMAGENNSSHGSLILFPENSPFPNMPKPTPDRRFMAMPAYLGGNFGTTGVKWY